jgi:plasmid maintenance system killer protein
VAAKYLQRLDLLRGVDSLAALEPSRGLHLHPLTGPRAGTWAISLTEQWRLIVRPVEGGVIVEEVTNHYE